MNSDDYLYRDPPNRQSDNRTDTHLHDKQLEQIYPKLHVVYQYLQQTDGEEDRHGVVGCTFNLQRRFQPAVDMDTRISQQGKYGGRIGRAYDSTQKQPLQKRQVENVGGGKPGYGGGDQHPEGRQHGGGLPHQLY